MTDPARVALDATYSLGDHLSGVGVYCREILFGVARAHPETRFHLQREGRSARALGLEHPNAWLDIR